MGIENDNELLNNFVYFSQPPEAPVTYIKNNGPRMGMSFVGDMGKVIQNPEAIGGLTPLTNDSSVINLRGPI